jgi:F0F1-type ATP synthase membrane subunit b/b'
MKEHPMADSPYETSNNQPQQADLQKQIEDLRSEVAKIRDSISSLLEDATDRASDLYDAATDTALRAGSRLKTEAQSLSQTVQENPGAISAMFVLGGLLGLLVGFALGQSDRHRSLF